MNNWNRGLCSYFCINGMYQYEWYARNWEAMGNQCPQKDSLLSGVMRTLKNLHKKSMKIANLRNFSYSTILQFLRKFLKISRNFALKAPNIERFEMFLLCEFDGQRKGNIKLQVLDRLNEKSSLNYIYRKFFDFLNKNSMENYLES